MPSPRGLRLPAACPVALLAGDCDLVGMTGMPEAVLARELRDRHAGFRLLDEPDDLLFGKSALLHVRHSPG